MNMNLKPAFRYQIGSVLRATAVFFFIVVLIVVALLVGVVSINVGTNTTVSISGVTLTLAVFLFVLGIVNIRSDLRLCLQFGVSRRSTFVSSLLTIVAVSAALAVAAELITYIFQIITADKPSVYYRDLYQLLYLSKDIKELALGHHALSALLNLSIMIVTSVGGMFFSLLFWRLNKFFTVVAAISIPLLLNIVPIIIYKAKIDMVPFKNWLASSPLNLIAFSIFLAVLVGTINWLLLRRANIKAAK